MEDRVFDRIAQRLTASVRSIRNDPEKKFDVELKALSATTFDGATDLVNAEIWLDLIEICKANVVANALSRNTRSARASINSVKGTLIHELFNARAALSVGQKGGLLASFQVRPTLVEDILHEQLKDFGLQKLAKEMDKGLRMDYQLRVDKVLLKEGRICIPKDLPREDLIEFHLENQTLVPVEVHQTPKLAHSMLTLENHSKPFVVYGTEADLIEDSSLFSDPKTLILASMFSRSFLTATGAAISASSHSSFSLLRRLRPLAAIVAADFRCLSAAPSVRELATRAASSSLNDPNPNWSNRPPKETILLDGCDFEHWLVVMEKPEENLTRDEIIDSYIKTLAMVVGSEEEARMKIYSVSTRCYFAFGCLVSEELSYKIKELPKVRWVLPDSYLDVKNKDYGGEPFINGQAVPYDPKYHEEWIRNNARANERNRRNDRPRNFDRSRNFERRRDNMQNREFPNASTNQPTGPNMSPPAPSSMPPKDFSPSMPPHNHAGMPQGNYPGGPPPLNNFNKPPPPHNFNGPPPPPPRNNFNGPPPPPPLNNFNGPPSPPPPNFNGPPSPPPPRNNYAPPPPNPGGAPPHNFGGPQPNNYWGAPQPNNYGGPSISGRPPAQNSYGGVQPNAGGWSNNVHNNQQE
ncbi:multiple organellar RNA editing factor 8, chloroplastic/mitochondrial-like [Benincasa hispida]|uniref:multiple organellar RNA editing factor 8, chloroplastic/mitochondrial-like n=1 Tax=Benincasa hispida TaxID=102211 RepID=UPI0019001029|nr:multiple organellar RNA editing factor 8, chloroplastic/mitochondrial-like [Benincasa hispida]